MERRSRISIDSPGLKDRTRPRSFDIVKRSTYTHNLDLRPHKPQHPKPSHIAKTAEPNQQTSRTVQDISAQPAKLVTAAPRIEIDRQQHLPKQSRSNVLKRQMVKQAAKLRPSKHRWPLMPTLLTAMAVMLFMAGVLVLVSTLRTNDSVKAQVKQLSQQTDDDGITDELPSEDNPPTNLGDYKVAPDMPRFFNIEKLGVHARVKRVGVSADNVLKAPANIFDVGWYDGSAKPGENGTVVLDGHVSGPTKHGVFYNAGSLKAGDKVQLERGDGKVLSYTVTAVETHDYDKVDMSKVLTSSVPGKPALNFMTCAGRFNVRTNSFEQRIVVFTVQD